MKSLWAMLRWAEPASLATPRLSTNIVQICLEILKNGNGKVE